MITFTRLAILCFLLCAFASLREASAANPTVIFQTGTISGQPFTNAAVEIERINVYDVQSNRIFIAMVITNVTDYQGNFTITNLEPFDYRITVDTRDRLAKWTNCFDGLSGTVYASDHICGARATNGPGYPALTVDRDFLRKTNSTGMSNTLIRPRIFITPGATNPPGVSNYALVVTNITTGETDLRALPASVDLSFTNSYQPANAALTNINTTTVNLTNLANAKQNGSAALTNLSGNPNVVTNIVSGGGPLAVSSNNAGTFTITSSAQPADPVLTNLVGTGAFTNMTATTNSVMATVSNNFVVIVARSGSSIWASNGEAIIFTNNIPLNLLGTNRTADVLLECQALNNTTGSSNMTIKVIVGSTVYNSIWANVGAASVIRPGFFHLRVSNLDSTSSQMVKMDASFGTTTAASITGNSAFAAGTLTAIAGVVDGSASADTTANVPIAVTITPSIVTPALFYLRMYHSRFQIE